MFLIFVHQVDFPLQLFIFQMFTFEIEFNRFVQGRLANIAVIQTTFDKHTRCR